MRPTTRLNNPARWSAQLRLNALWSIWFAYFLGSAVAGHLPQGQRLVLDLACLAGLSLISALWNDWADQEADTGNKRTFAWHTLTSARSLLIASCLLFGLTALLDPYRLLFSVAVLPLGYLYNARHWSGRPHASQLLYAGYYRIAPFFLGFAASGPQIQGQWPWIFLLGLGLGTLRFSTGIYKDFPDQNGDRLAGRTTFVLNYGSRRSAQASGALWLVGGAIFLRGLAELNLALAPAALCAWILAGSIRTGLLLRASDRAYQETYFARAFQAENFLILSLLIAAAAR